MWSSCFALIGKNGLISIFALQWAQSRTKPPPEKFFRNFYSHWKKARFWCPYIMGESIVRGDDYGKEQPL